MALKWGVNGVGVGVLWAFGAYGVGVGEFFVYLHVFSHLVSFLSKNWQNFAVQKLGVGKDRTQGRLTRVLDMWLLVVVGG